MRKTIKLAVVAALALGTTSVFATNGSTMNGLGAKARGMASVGIGMSHGAESILANPALITSTNGTEISFGGTLFMPDVENSNTLVNFATNTANPGNNVKSDADTFVIPSISIAHKINDNFYTGIGMWGTGGLGVDYRNANTAMDTQMQMVTSLQIMQFGVPLVYKMNNLSMGITPLIQYGTLDINYANPLAGGATVGAGVGSDLSMGYNLGLSYATAGLTLGAVYKSQIDMDYDGQLKAAIAGMGVGYNNDTLSTPAEMGIGFSYAMGQHTIAMDYKVINWEDAEGYKDFGWEDQKIIAVGYQYTTDGWAVRMGYSKADSAVQDNTGKNLKLDTDMAAVMQGGFGATMPTNYAGLTNTFNSLGFPGNVESHYALGGTYNFSKTVSIDLAYMYAPEVTTTLANFTGMPNTASVKHSETSYSAQLNLAF